MAVHKIMVVVDPTLSDHPEFDQALQSARMTGSKLHVYACATAGEGNDEAHSESERDRVVSEYRQLVDALVTRAISEKVDCAGEVDWAEDWRNQIVTAAARCAADMVFKYTHVHNVAQRGKRETSDWALLRQSPCPVLLVKGIKDWQHKRVLGAVKLESNDEAHAGLNEQVIGLTRGFAAAYESDAHYVNAYRDLYNVPDPQQLAEDYDVPTSHIHLGHGTAAEVISRTAQELDVDLVIIGTLARTGIMGSVIGNTAEKVLDQTDADLLVLS